MQLNKSKGLGLECSEEACPEQGATRIQRDVETRDTGVGGRESGVIRRSDGNTWGRLVGLCVGR